MRDCWEVWRLVNAQRATLAEIERWWSCDDVLDANESLDHEADVEIWLRGPMPPPKPKP